MMTSARRISRNGRRAPQNQRANLRDFKMGLPVAASSLPRLRSITPGPRRRRGVTAARRLALLGAALSFVGLSGAAHAQTATKVGADACDYVDGTTMVRIALPENIDATGGFVRGILIEGNGGTGDNRGIAMNILRRNFAGRYGFATAGTGGIDGTQTFASKGAIVLRGIELCGAMLGHPETKDAPFISWGASSGGALAYGIAMLAPKRAIAFGANVPAALNPANPTDEMLAIPGMFSAGQLDMIVGPLTSNVGPMMTRARPRGALWSKNEMEGVGHADGHVFDMWIPFLDKAIAKRLPPDADPRKGPVTLLPVAESSGYLLDDSTWDTGLTTFAAYADFPGDKRGANTSWVIDEDMARQQRAFTSRRRVVDLTLMGRSDAAVFGFVTRQKVGTTIELTGVATKYPGWTTATLFRGAKMIASVTNGEPFKFSVPIAADDPNGLAFHAIVDGPMGMKVTQPWTVLKLPGAGAPPEPMDAGAAGASGTDAGASDNAGSSGSAGTGGSGASAGTGGQTAPRGGSAGGAAAAGASGAKGGDTGSSSSGGGCAFGGSGATGGGVLLVLLACVLRRRKR